MAIEFKNSVQTRNAAVGITECIFDKDLTIPQGICCTLWVGGNGDIKVETFNGSIGTFKTVPAGTHLPVQVRKIIGEGTTVPAAQITCLY